MRNARNRTEFDEITIEDLRERNAKLVAACKAALPLAEASAAAICLSVTNAGSLAAIGWWMTDAEQTLKQIRAAITENEK